jgi:gliding motility-associated-like protein
VSPGPEARFSFSPENVTTEETTVFFTNQSISSLSTIYYWEFDSLDTSYKLNPTFTFPDGVENEYYISLTARDTITGCMDIITRRVEVKPELIIYVPNAFTPDGDGLNDLWGPVLTNIDTKEYELLVFDRWGEAVFETSDPTLKWNGGLNNGDYYLEPEVYIWTLEVKEKGSLKEFKLNGQVTLVR